MCSEAGRNFILMLKLLKDGLERLGIPSMLYLIYFLPAAAVLLLKRNCNELRNFEDNFKNFSNIQNI